MLRKNVCTCGSKTVLVQVKPKPDKVVTMLRVCPELIKDGLNPLVVKRCHIYSQ